MKYRLLAPGPTPVPDRVLSVMSRSIFHHRTPAFEEVFRACKEGLKWLLETNYDVLTLASSGTGAFEAAFQNFLSPGDTVINVGGGKFGERWGQMAKVFGLNVVSADAPWGEAVPIADVKTALDAHPDAKAVVCVASETSTGVRHPYEAIAKLVQDRSDCIFIVDAITAAGVWAMCPEKDGIDVLVMSSQKAFMLPPGLAFLAVSPKAWQMQSKAKMPRYYFDLAREKKAQDQNQSAYTPAVSLMTGLAEALAMMKEEGRQSIFDRHHRMAKATREAMKALGLKLFAQVPADSVTSVCAPEHIKSNSIYTGLRDRANLTIAGGQDHLKGKIFRIAHLGYFDELDIFTVLCALEVILRQEGYTDFKPGASIAAATEVLQPGFAKTK